MRARLPLLRGAPARALLAGLVLAGGIPAFAQAGPGSAAASASARADAAAAQAASQRYVAACQQAQAAGRPGPGCQGTLHAGELARLEKEAVQTNDPRLLTMVGDAYESNRSGLSDVGRAYKWYLRGAVRGDQRALQRLGELHRIGSQALPNDIQALGYARLAQRLASPGSASAQEANATIGALSKNLSAADMALANQFADDLQARINAPAPADSPDVGAPAAPAAPAVSAPAAPPAIDSKLAHLPGMSAAQVPISADGGLAGTAQAGVPLPPPAQPPAVQASGAAAAWPMPASNLPGQGSLRYTPP